MPAPSSQCLLIISWISANPVLGVSLSMANAPTLPAYGSPGMSDPYAGRWHLFSSNNGPLDYLTLLMYAAAFTLLLCFAWVLTSTSFSWASTEWLLPALLHLCQDHCGALALEGWNAFIAALTSSWITLTVAHISSWLAFTEDLNYPPLVLWWPLF